MDAVLEISVRLGVEKDEIDRKIKNLVCHLSRELKKERDSRKSGAGTDQVYKSKWFCYGSMLFLKDRNRPRGMTDTHMQPLQSETVTPGPSPSQDNTKKTTTRTNAFRKRPISTDPYADEAQKNNNESFETSNHTLKAKKGEEDECDVYAKLLAKRLRKYPERMRDKIMYKIDGLLLDNPYPDERP